MVAAVRLWCDFQELWSVLQLTNTIRVSSGETSTTTATQPLRDVQKYNPCHCERLFSPTLTAFLFLCYTGSEATLKSQPPEAVRKMKHINIDSHRCCVWIRVIPRFCLNNSGSVSNHCNRETHPYKWLLWITNSLMWTCCLC